MKKEQIPFGSFYKKMNDNKYINVVDLRSDLCDSLVFCEALTDESEQNKVLTDKRQMHFEVSADSAGIYGITVSQGAYRTFERLIEENPAVVAGKDYTEAVIKGLLELTAYLHEKDIYHVCYAPSNIFVRKGDNMPLLLFHGSAYAAMKDQRLLYKDCEEYVAPEVFSDGTIDSRTDIFGIGKFMEYLYHDVGLPIELKSVVKKATNPDPEKRYQTPEQMLRAISSKHHARISLYMLLAAAAVALLFFGYFFSTVPEPTAIEFVKPAPQQAEENPLDEGFDSSTELGIYGQPKENPEVDEKKMKEYEAKAEQIFRKQYAKEADRILSKVYGSSHMNESEKKFMATSQAMTEELVKAQMKLGDEAGLSDAKSQRIASEIIERITSQKKKEMQKNVEGRD